MKRGSLLVIALLAILALAVAACGNDDDNGEVPDGAPDNGEDVTNGEDALEGNGDDTTAEPVGYARPELLETTETLQAKLDQDNVVIVDLRSREDYEAGHIPGAVWYDRGLLKDPEDDVNVITGEDLAALLGELGISNDDWVVAYDEGHGLWGTRFWWVLQYYGHNDASVLNGGFAKWEADGAAVASDPPQPEPAVFNVSIDEGVFCDVDYVLEQVAEERDDVVLLDVRSHAEFTGADVRAARGGHIPGAVNLDWVNSMTGEPQVWKSAEELREMFQEVGIGEDTEVITYCQTAVRGAHTFYTLELVGLGQARNYDGSWYEWGNLQDTPIQQ